MGREGGWYDGEVIREIGVPIAGTSRGRAREREQGRGTSSRCKKVCARMRACCVAGGVEGGGGLGGG